jgi:hypothetical protein
MTPTVQQDGGVAVSYFVSENRSLTNYFTQTIVFTNNSFAVVANYSANFLFIRLFMTGPLKTF